LAEDGTVTLAVVDVPVQPYRLVAPMTTVQPLGTSSTLNRTRSKNEALRLTLIAASAVPPCDEMSRLPPFETEKLPSVATRVTSSRGSWVESGSVQYFQPRLPRKRSDSRTSPGVANGRLALYRATAPVTCGVAIEVPVMYP